MLHSPIPVRQDWGPSHCSHGGVRATPPEQETKPASEWILAASHVNNRFLSGTAAISTPSCNMLRWACVSYNLGEYIWMLTTSLPSSTCSRTGARWHKANQEVELQWHFNSTSSTEDLRSFSQPPFLILSRAQLAVHTGTGIQFSKKQNRSFTSKATTIRIFHSRWTSSHPGMQCGSCSTRFFFHSALQKAFLKQLRSIEKARVWASQLDT